MATTGWIRFRKLASVTKCHFPLGAVPGTEWIPPGFSFHFPLPPPQPWGWTMSAVNIEVGVMAGPFLSITTFYVWVNGVSIVLRKVFRFQFEGRAP